MAGALDTLEGGPAAPPPAALPVPSPSGSPSGALTGRSKAAVLLVSLGPERAAEVFKHLRDDEIESLSLEMAKTRNVPATALNDVFAEVIATAMAFDSIAEGGVEYAQKVLEKALGADRAADIIGRLSAVIERRPFEFLRRTPPDQIYAFLRNESPQTLALVIANLHTTLAAQVLGLLEPEQQSDVARRIAQMSDLAPDVVRRLEDVLRKKLSNVASQDYASAGGVKSLAQILNQADRPTERNVLDFLTERDQELAEEVRRLLFTFEDIVKLDDRSIQMVLKEVDQKDLALALRGVHEEVVNRILANMSERGAEMLREEMEYQPPQRKRVVEEAQGKIVAVVRRLEESGAIVLARGNDGDDAVV